MKAYRFEIILGALLLALFLAFAHWQAPHRPLTPVEVEHYLGILDRDLPWPAQEKAEISRHLRAWAEADDGNPVYMLNLMRYYPTLREIPGVEGFTGTPEQANAHYEDSIVPVLLRLGVEVMFASQMQGVLGGAQPSTNLIHFDPALDNWSRVLIVRYPSRRAFLQLITDPGYMPYVPYKAASLMVALAPMKGDVVMPDSILGAGAIGLILFFALAWVHALRRAHR